MYFRLNPECYLIKGDHCSAIYDLIEGNVHSLDADETQLIQNCENNQPVEINESFLNELKDQCVGNYYDTKIYVQKLRISSPVIDYQIGNPPILKRAFLEINNTCNLSCWYCGARGAHRSSGCMGCNIWQEEGTALGTEEWKQVIDGLSDLKCSSIFFTGGDLTLNWGLTKELLDYAQAKFSQIFVIINRKRFSNTIEGDIKEKAIPIIQTDDIAEINYDYPCLLITEGNSEIPKNILSSNRVIIDTISKDFSGLPEDSSLMSKTKIQKTDVFRFSHTRKKHPCLANTLTVSWKGEVLPCPLLRRHSLGTVKKRQLYEIFKENAEKLENFWTMNLGKIQKCDKCEFRYACNDCRALEEALTGDLYGKSLCSYDPKKGVWV